jgi:hypothetical protein
MVLAADTIRRHHCLGCHARDGKNSPLGERIARWLGEDAELRALKGTLNPPDLTGVGDKLRPESLHQAIGGKAPVARPWLSPRMPVYSFAAGEAEAIAAWFRVRDQVSSAPSPSEPPTRSDPTVEEEAIRLVGRQGFGCVSCHVLAGKIPPGGEAETLGPDLALAHQRMTERYFLRWVSNPQRILPGTPMPQFLQPAPGHEGTLDDQLRRIWIGLGSPRLPELAAIGTRDVLRQKGDRAWVVRDMVVHPELPGNHLPRGLVIGLKGDDSLLFDTDRLSWVAWWRGGFLNRTKSGRLWEWHPEGTFLWKAPARDSPLVFVDRQGESTPPREVRERFGRFDRLEFQGSGVLLRYSLHGPTGALIEVQERLVPIANGCRREVRVAGVPDGWRPVIRLSWAEGTRLGDSPLSWNSEAGRVVLRTDSLVTSPSPTLRFFSMRASAPQEFEATQELVVEGP